MSLNDIPSSERIHIGFFGRRNVGKSSLVNAVTGQQLSIVSETKGTTTDPVTKSMEILPLGPVVIIDTPGIKGFGAVQMEKEEISHYFREIFRIGRECRYSNCLHTGEPGCAVHDAVVDGRIAISRYESYLSLLGDCDEAKYR